MLDIDTLNFIYPFQTKTIILRSENCNQDTSFKFSSHKITQRSLEFCLVSVLYYEKKKEISRTRYCIAFSRIWALRVKTPGAALKYFNDGGVGRIFLGLTFWPKEIFLGRENNRGIFWVLYFSSAQIKNNMSAIYSFVFEQNQSWSWHVLAFQKIYNKIC